MSLMILDAGAAARVSELAQRYFWWAPVSANGFSLKRQVAQIMHLGTYEDIRRLESVVSADALARAMRESEAGWFDDRSWDFWRGRLSRAGVQFIPEERPRRTFARVPAP